MRWSMLGAGDSWPDHFIAEETNGYADAISQPIDGITALRPHGADWLEASYVLGNAPADPLGRSGDCRAIQTRSYAVPAS